MEQLEHTLASPRFPETIVEIHVPHLQVEQDAGHGQDGAYWDDDGHCNCSVVDGPAFLVAHLAARFALAPSTIPIGLAPAAQVARVAGRAQVRTVRQGAVPERGAVAKAVHQSACLHGRFASHAVGLLCASVHLLGVGPPCKVSVVHDHLEATGTIDPHASLNATVASAHSLLAIVARGRLLARAIVLAHLVACHHLLTRAILLAVVIARTVATIFRSILAL